jgi:holo-[acyl-carrier protein] synthase
MRWLHENGALYEEDGEMKGDEETLEEAESRRQEAEGRSQKAEGRSQNPESGIQNRLPLSVSPVPPFSVSVSSPNSQLRTPHDSAVGIDIVEVARIEGAVKRHGRRFLDRVFTVGELEYASGKKRRAETLAGRFAAKEAFMKAMGRRLPWRQVEIGGSGGAPFVLFGGKALRGLSISHERSHAVAVFVAPCHPGRAGTEAAS